MSVLPITIYGDKILRQSAKPIKSIDDEVIRDEKMFWVKLNYIHNNPVKAEIVNRAEEYKYSSARNYILGDCSVIKVDTGYGGIQSRNGS